MKAIKPHGELVEAARAIGICFGDQPMDLKQEAFSSENGVVASLPAITPS
jgi:hypothetical protein